MVELLEGCDNSNIQLPKINDFKIPYIITNESIDLCLKKLKTDNPPFNMYV